MTTSSSILIRIFVEFSDNRHCYKLSQQSVMICKLINNLSGTDTKGNGFGAFLGFSRMTSFDNYHLTWNHQSRLWVSDPLTFPPNEKPSSLASEIIKPAHKACARQKDTKSFMLLNCGIDCCKVFFSLQLSRRCFLLACIWNFHDYEKAKRHEQKSNGESHNQSCCVAL